LRFTNGFIFKGEFENGKITGIGQVYDSENELLVEGIWEENLFRGVLHTKK